MSRRSLTVLLLALAIVAVAWLALRTPGEPGRPPPLPALRDGPPPSPPPDLAEKGAPERPTEEQAELDAPAEEPLAGMPVVVRGRIVRVGGAPVADARVVLAAQHSPLSLSRAMPDHGVDRSGHRYVRTDDRGRFEFRSILVTVFLQDGPLSGYTLLAFADGGMAMPADPPEEKPPVDVGDVVLVPGVKLRVRVTAGGEPAARTEVVVRASAPGSGLYVFSLWERTDREGLATFLPLAIQETWTLSLTVHHLRYGTHERTVRGPEALRGEPILIDVPVGMRVKGRIVLPTGEPAAKAVIEVHRTGGAIEYALGRIAGADGGFDITGVPAEGVRLSIQLRGRFVPYFTDEIRGVNGRVVDLGTIRLGEGGSIRGMVVDGAGAPVAGALVGAKVPWCRHWGLGTRTGDDGRFEITDLPPGDYEVRASRHHRDYGVREARVSGVSPGSADVLLRITAGNAAVLRFRPAGDPSGTLALKAGAVRATPMGADAGAGSEFQSYGGARLYRLDLEPGTYEIRFKTKGYREVTIESVVVTADEDTVVDVLLEPE